MNEPRSLLCWSCWEHRHAECYGPDLCDCGVCDDLARAILQALLADLI